MFFISMIPCSLIAFYSTGQDFRLFIIRSDGATLESAFIQKVGPEAFGKVFTQGSRVEPVIAIGRLDEPVFSVRLGIIRPGLIIRNELGDASMLKYTGQSLLKHFAFDVGKVYFISRDILWYNLLVAVYAIGSGGATLVLFFC